MDKCRQIERQEAWQKDNGYTVLAIKCDYDTRARFEDIKKRNKSGTVDTLRLLMDIYERQVNR